MSPARWNAPSTDPARPRAARGRAARRRRAKSNRRCRRRAKLGRSAFTLFEVLAAVAILGILYTVLARLAMDGLRHEGEAERRMRASLVADQVLAELEHGFLAGIAPPIATSESEKDEFTIRTEVRALDLTGFAASLAPPGTEGTPAAARVAPDLPAMLVPPPAGAPPLLEIEVVVSWIEGVAELETRRLTYGFDAAAVTPILEVLGAPEEGAAPGTEPEEES